jgi:2-polyprenyl-3-methyl-5-hydroxy-6-metoxy-1,4-benzoquinol methylase
MHNNILQEQLNYYRARAQEYDASLQPVHAAGEGQNQAENREWMQAIQSLGALGPYHQVLELAGGTGIWTRELTRIADDITVLDGSPEMLAINRAKINDPRVRYECVDLFSWEPQRKYELVFFAFWLSHVPPELLDPFLDKLPQAVSPGGGIFIVDEPAGGRQVSGPTQGGRYQQRTLQDGRVFHIIKIYYDPQIIQQKLRQRGFTPALLQVGQYFFHLASTLDQPA